jgi:two-component system OmpR family response regulator
MRRENYTVDEAKNGEEWLYKATTSIYDTILLDMNMPVMSGADMLSMLREKWIYTPVIAITSNSHIDDKERMYALGVDDYIVKPFEMRELLLRIQALAKKREVSAHTPYICISSEIYSDIQVDTVSLQVYVWDIVYILPTKELQILVYLCAHIGIPRSKSDILEHVWGEREGSLDIASITVEVHIANLRKKLWKEIIHTVRGIGYRVKST